MNLETIDWVVAAIDNLHTKGYISDIDYTDGMNSLCDTWGTEFIADRLMEQWMRRWV